mgnify:CR=1 FL=1|jgi:arylsulfatase A
MLDMAGRPRKPRQHLDGLSLAPLLRNPASPLGREAIFFHHPHDHHINSMGSSGAVRAGDYKLVEAYHTGEVKPYNLAADLGEQKVHSRRHRRRPPNCAPFCMNGMPEPEPNRAGIRSEARR